MTKEAVYNSIKVILSYLFTAFMLWLVFDHLNTFSLADLKLAPAAWTSLLGASLLVVAANIVRSYRWTVILNNRKKYPLSKTISSTFLGMWFNILTTTGGNVIIKPLHLAFSTGSRYWKIFGSCVVERFFDSVFTLILLLITLACLRSFIDYNFYIAIAIAIALTVISLTMLFLHPDHKLLSLLKYLLPLNLFRQLRFILYHLNKGGFHIRSRDVVAKSTIISVCYWMLHISANYVLLLTLDIPASLISFSAALIATAFMSASMAVPAVAAGAGVMNYGVFVALKMLAGSQGITPTAALDNQFLLYSLLVYLSNLLPEIVAGGFFYFKERKNLFAIRQIRTD